MKSQQNQAEALPSSDSSPSSPLSELSRSPSLPSSPTTSRDVSHRYPSPSASSLASAPTSSGSATPIKSEMQSTSISVRTDVVSDAPYSSVEPPRKRRRTGLGPKERTTEYLDLERVRDLGAFDPDSQRKLDRLVSTFRRQKKVVVVAGAGISVSAGIPDFRSKEGLFATLPSEHKIKGSGKHLFDASVYKHNDTTESFHKMVCDLDAKVREAEPTPFHHMLASMAAEDRLLRLYSQNVDGLDTRMAPLATDVPLNTKAPWPKTIQLHGSVGHMNCSKCSETTQFQSGLFVNHEAPLCPSCQELDAVRTAHAGKRSHGVGRLRPRMVLYNEYNPDEEAIGKVSSADLKRVPDAVVVVGTSFKIPGVRRLVKELTQATRSKRGGFTAWINLDSEPQQNEFKDCWDLVVRAKADDVAHFVQLPRWDEPAVDRTTVLSKEDARLRHEYLRRDKFEIQLPSSQTLRETPPYSETKIETKVDKVQGIPTPSASPRMPASLPANSKVAKTKQSKLSFAQARTDHVVDSDTSTVAAAKKRKRAPAKKAGKSVSTKKSAKEPPKNTVTQSFRTVKNTSRPLAATSKEIKGLSSTKPEKDVPKSFMDSGELPSLRPNRPPSGNPIAYTPERGLSSELSEAPPSSSPLLPPSSTSRRTKLPSSPPQRSSPCAGLTTIDRKSIAVAEGLTQPRDAPTTPPMQQRRASSAEETISPKSIPRGMEALMD